MYLRNRPSLSSMHVNLVVFENCYLHVHVTNRVSHYSANTKIAMSTPVLYQNIPAYNCVFLIVEHNDILVYILIFICLHVYKATR